MALYVCEGGGIGRRYEANIVREAEYSLRRACRTVSKPTRKSMVSESLLGRSSSNLGPRTMGERTISQKRSLDDEAFSLYRLASMTWILRVIVWSSG